MTGTTTDVIDGVSGSTAIKAPVRCATTANITLSGFQTIDGVALTSADENLRILVKDQTDTTENGIYNADSGTWARAADFDGNRDVRKGTIVHVNEGSVQANTAWRCTSADPVVIDTSNITFSQSGGFSNSAATTTTQGIVELATDAEAIAKSDTGRVLTPSNLAALGGSATFAGLLELATDAEAQTGTDTARALTAANLQAVTGTETRKGVLELATNAEVTAGTDTARAVTPAGLAQLLSTETVKGLVELATAAEVVTGTDTSRAVTPAGLSAYAFHNLALQAFVTPGANTYTPTSGMKYCIAFSTGGGGGGGGADTDGSSATVGVGAGGGAGATCIELFTAAQIGASQTVTIGAAGTAGSATNGATGGNGGDTTFGALHTAGGGVGGTGSGVSAASNPEVAGAAGGTATNGLLNISGGRGGSAVGGAVDGTTDITFGYAGHGGASFWGGGGDGAASANGSLSADIEVAGIAADAYGAGGGGAVCLTSTTGAAGGAGKPGVCLVIEFI